MLEFKNIILTEEDEDWLVYQIDADLALFGMSCLEERATLSVHRDIDVKNCLPKLSDFIDSLEGFRDALEDFYSGTYDVDIDGWYESLDIYGASFIVLSDMSIVAGFSALDGVNTEETLEIEIHGDKVISMEYVE